jgi:hypothetical protein
MRKDALAFMDSGKQIIQYLDELASALIDLQVTTPFHLLIAGGAYMLLQNSRRSTEDIDFALIAGPHSQVEPNKVFQTTVQRAEVSKLSSRVPCASEFRQAIEIVAQARGLESDWLNDQSAVYYYDDAPSPDVSFWRSFGGVIFVYLPTKEYIFATKIAAYRVKDQEDIKLLVRDLDLRTREQAQAIVDKFLLPEAQQFWQVPRKLKRVFR